jgi:hypothetical protein
LLVFIVAPSSQELEPPPNPGRFNLIEEGYFDNCYTFEQFLEDVQHCCALLDRVAALEAALARIGNPTEGGTG